MMDCPYKRRRDGMLVFHCPECGEWTPTILQFGPTELASLAGNQGQCENCGALIAEPAYLGPLP